MLMLMLSRKREKDSSISNYCITLVRSWFWIFLSWQWYNWLVLSVLQCIRLNCCIFQTICAFCDSFLCIFPSDVVLCYTQCESHEMKICTCYYYYLYRTVQIRYVTLYTATQKHINFSLSRLLVYFLFLFHAPNDTYFFGSQPFSLYHFFFLFSFNLYFLPLCLCSRSGNMAFVIFVLILTWFKELVAMFDGHKHFLHFGWKPRWNNSKIGSEQAALESMYLEWVNKKIEN